MRGLGSVLAVGISLAAIASDTSPKVRTVSDSKSLKQKLGKQNQRFIENVGQWDSRGRFLARTGTMDVWLTNDGLTMNVHRPLNAGKSNDTAGQVVGLQFVGKSSQSEFVGLNKQRIDTDFILSHDRKLSAKSFDAVLQKNVYSGIDFKTYMDGGQPRYDFVVAPGADAGRIKFAVKGADNVSLKNESLVLKTHVGDLYQGKIFAYQMVNGAKKSVPAKFHLDNAGEVTFALGAYDHSKTLVIDPLIYGSYYGGDNGMDEVTGVTSDSTGGTYLTGWTFATRFPVLFGPYGINYPGLTAFRQAFVAKLQGDAYSHDYSAYLSGTLGATGEYVQVDPFGNLWVAGRTPSADFPGNTRNNIQFLKGFAGTDGGTFILKYQDVNISTSWVLPFDVTPAQVQAAVEADTRFTGKIKVTSVGGSTLSKGDTYQFSSTNALAGGWTTTSTRVVQGTNEISQGLPPLIVVDPANNGLKFFQFLRRGSTPPPATAAIQFTFNDLGAGTTATSTVLSAYASAAAVQTALQALTNIGANNILVAGGPIPNAPMQALIVPASTALGQMSIANGGMTNNAYTFKPVTTDVFLLRFARTATGGLDPLIDKKTHSLIWGGLGNEALAGFSIVPMDNPPKTTPVQLVFAGWTSGNDLGSDMPTATPGGQVGYVAKYTYNGVFKQIAGATKFISSTFPITVSGVTTDAQGSAYVAGTIYGKGNTNLGHSSTVFATYSGSTDNVYSTDNARGDLLRGNDIFVRKYKTNGDKGYSVVIGGNGDDAAGGLVTDVQGISINTGSCIAVDSNLNAYVTGVSGGYNFPRTRGVYGENFGPDAVVTVTKLNSDASALVYSTNLRTTGVVTPAGIGVDNRGYAFITMLLSPTNVRFPVPPADPNQPSSWSPASIPITADALDPVYESPQPPELPTTEGALFVLNDTATQDVYSTYIGGILDEFIYAPYVDKFGDVWVYGSTDSGRDYVRVSSTGSVTEYLRLPRTAFLPAALISPLAFKQGPDAGGGGFAGLSGVLYGLLESPFTSPATISTGVTKDGFIIKQRIAQASVANVTVTPSSAPGGAGVTITGTVTLSQPAPAGGADITITLDSTTAASLDPASAVATTTINFAGGATTGTFTIYTSPVSVNTNVQVKADYQGSFKIAQFVVVPWLQQLTVTPSSIVGGNSVTGKITLSAPAPTGGLVVNLKTDTAALVSFPGGDTVTVAAGQTTAAFNISTNGVSVTSVANVKAVLLGLEKSQPITLTLSNLKSLTFSPPRVAGGSTSTATVVLDGAAGAAFTMNITSNAPGTYNYPTTVTFPAGATTASFDVVTPYEASNTSYLFTATRPAQGNYVAEHVANTLFVDNLDLSTFAVTLDDADDAAANTLSAGNTATGLVTITTTAPAGGVIVNLTTSNGLITAPASVTVPAGSTSASFTMTAPVSSSSGNCVITASRGPKSLTQTVAVVGVGIGLDVPSSIIGGTTGTGSVSITKNVGSVPIVINLSVPAGSPASVPSSITFGVGSTTLSKAFTINTTAVTTGVNVVVTATSGSQTVQKTVFIRPVGVLSVKFAKSTVAATQSTTMSVTLDGPAPAGGIDVTISWSSAVGLAVGFPTTIHVDAGQTVSGDYTVATARVSRNISTTATATYQTSSASATLTITR